MSTHSFTHSDKEIKRIVDEGNSQLILSRGDLIAVIHEGQPDVIPIQSKTYDLDKDTYQYVLGWL